MSHSPNFLYRFDYDCFPWWIFLRPENDYYCFMWWIFQNREYTGQPWQRFLAYKVTEDTKIERKKYSGALKDLADGSHLLVVRWDSSSFVGRGLTKASSCLAQARQSEAGRPATLAANH